MGHKQTNTLLIEGMTCTSCAAGVQKIIEHNGGKQVRVNFSTGEAKYVSSKRAVHERIAKAVNKGGYHVVTGEEAPNFSRVEKLFAFCLFFTFPLFLHMFAGKNGILNDPIFQISFTLPVLLTGGFYFIKSGFSSIKNGVPNMDVLVSVGVLSSFFYSCYGVLLHWGAPDVHEYLFFETTATVTTLVLLGNVIEHRAVKQTTSAIADLNDLQSQTANKWVEGKVEQVQIKEIKLGDRLQVNEGDVFPVDGVITQGAFEVDQSMISGESEPVFKKVGSSVVGGSLVRSGTGQMIASSVVGASTLDKIISLVKDAQDSKPAIQRLGDKISAVFVPVVLGISVITFFVAFLFFDLGIQKSMMNSIAVLVISCPCAMGLAAPTAIMVGVGKAAKKGILIKGGQTLEKIAKSKTIVFDKTGTLTTGNFEINKLELKPWYDLGREPNDLAHDHDSLLEGVRLASKELFQAPSQSQAAQQVYQVLLALCSKSSHPISKSLHAQLSVSHNPESLNHVREIKGKGMRGEDVNGCEWELYSSKSENLKSGLGLKSDLCVLKDKRIIAELWISDEIKEGVKENIQWLKSNGFLPVMLSGDTKTKCTAAAKEVGITECYFEKTPKEKLDVIKKLTQENPTIMVGDGINDAPSLAQAHVGISFGEATSSAISASDVVLMNKDFSSIRSAVSLSKQTYLTIKYNFFWAFAYNMFAIPVAAFGFLKPMISALSMAFSDVLVVGNSLLLKFKKE